MLNDLPMVLTLLCGTKPLSQNTTNFAHHQVCFFLVYVLPKQAPKCVFFLSNIFQSGKTSAWNVLGRCQLQLQETLSGPEIENIKIKRHFQFDLR